MKDFTRLKLGELLTHSNKIIRDNATSILRTLQKIKTTTKTKE